MNRSQLIGLSNEIDEQGWCKLCPYGDSRKVTMTQDGAVRTYIQRLDKEGAVALANGFNSFWGRLKRAVASVPLYHGHPDMARIVPDQVSGQKGAEMPVGSINRLEARDNGLYAQVALFPDGQALANEGEKWISPFWWTVEKEKRGVIPVVQPVELISGGLTSRPNIEGGDALANTQTDQTIMKQLLIGFLAARGIALANSVSEEDMLGRLQGVVTKLEGDVATINTEKTALANEKAALLTDKQSLTDQVVALVTEKQQLTEAAKTTTAALANERATVCGLLVDLAIEQGKVAIADREQRITRLKEAKDFESEKNALANEQVKFPTTGSTNRGDRKPEAKFDATAREKIYALCNERVKTGENFDAAWDAVTKDPKNADLVSAMRAKQ